MRIKNSYSQIFCLRNYEKGGRLPSGNLPPCRKCGVAQRTKRVLSKLMDYFITLNV